MSPNFENLIDYGKAFSGLSPELEACLKDIAPEIVPHLQVITDTFYEQLIKIPRTAKFVDGRLDKLKHAHLNWLVALFSSRVDAEFARSMYKVGDIHVKVDLPVEFMAGAMTLINKELVQLVFKLFGNDQEKCAKAVCAISAITGLTLMIMQQSYQESALAKQEQILSQERERFLSISGMSKSLFTNLANAYN